jgi:DNA-directed RNA polymerase subunit RPC12/RpoP
MTQKFRIEPGIYTCTECGKEIKILVVPTVWNPTDELIVREDRNNEIWHPNQDAHDNYYECGPMTREPL